ncbi:hypothetical protein GCM10010967_55980 [Dyadobacter beijingensis]|uniref:Secreted protein (Por secretion system target) n=1 Tax=Dyadobacter beijingensis TaxID=365489 RepID=A0ABQ2IK08_9BACT|nr:T9SS type A sorting domain-containing protein [Dyadobacter beijingensis]GGN12784.1 hypothetical protein GCM10010967_55980 [Dyadobacter beijingensis]
MTRPLRLNLVPILFLFIVLCFCVSTAFSQCDLVPLGPSGENQASYGYAFNLSSASFQNKTFICYKDKASRIFVRQWDGVAWTTLGDGPVSGTKVVMDPHMVVDQAGRLYVIYREVYNAAHIAVRMWNGVTWTSIGGEWVIDDYWGGSSNMVNRLAIAVDPANQVYIATFDQRTSEKLTVMKWDGTSWAFVGSRGFSSGFVTDIHFAFDAEARPYVGFIQSYLGANAEIMKFDSGNWVSVASVNNLAFLEYMTFLCNDRNGNIYFAHKTAEAGREMRINRLENGNLISVGSNNQTGFSDLMSLSADAAGNLYLVYSDRNNIPGKPAVRKWENGIWSDIALGLNVDSRAAVNAVSFTDDGKMRFVYAESNGEAILQEWDGAGWTELVSRGISDGIASNVSAAINQRGVPYVFYQDMKNGFRGVVKRWTGSAWVTVGGPIPADNPVYNQLIVLDEAGVPYIAFTDLWNDFKLSVMKLVNDQWQLVGTPNFSDGLAGWPSIAFKNGVPYMAYSDKSLGWKAVVKKWNGSAWEAVGAGDASGAGASMTQISVDEHGNPLLVYLDGNGNDAGKPVVKRWNGSTWEKVGSGDISAANVSQPRLATHRSGAIYLAYQNMYLDQELVVQKWDGSQWTRLGNSNISTGLGTTVRLDTDNGGAPVMAFLDAALDNQLITKRWNGSAWITTGQWTITSHFMTALSVAFDQAGVPFAAFSHGDVYARMGRPALAGGQESQTIDIGESSSGAFSENCGLIAVVRPGGANPVGGNVTAKVWVETAQRKAFVNRHYEITPASNAGEATGRVTLYFTQADFDAYNAVNAVKLPAGPSDSQGIGNVLIEKRRGESADQSGLPNSYPGEATNINPEDADIFWNVAGERWEVSFDVAGFSGFFVKTSETPLPVTLIKFSAGRLEGNVLLKWETTSEIAASHFEIERSSDAKRFQTIGLVASNGYSSRNNLYSFRDDHPHGKDVTYYRLRMVDLDGSFSYSRTVSLGDLRNGDALTVYPNPVKRGSLMTIGGNAKPGNVKLYSGDGITSWEGAIKNDGNSRFLIGNMPSGIYLLKIETYTGVTTKSIVIE